MKNGLIKQTLVDKCIGYAAAGTGTSTGDALDMSGFEGVLFIASIGAVTSGGVVTLKAQASSDDGVADGYSDLEGTGIAETDPTEKVIALEVYRPAKRYIKPILIRATQNAVIESVIAIRYGASKMPTSQGADVAASEFHASPAEGTA